MSKTDLPSLPATQSKPQIPAPTSCAVASGSAPRFARRDDTDNLCSAMYRGHGIACARHWRHNHVWLCRVVNAAGEVVADYRHEGHDRREMLIGAARAAGILPNAVVSQPRGQTPE